MIRIAIYLSLLLISNLFLCLWLVTNNEPPELKHIKVLLYCILAGGLGGIIYCLRGIYLSACVRKNWDKDWYPWYFIRPIVSLLTGGVSYVFLKAGLLVLESQSKANSSHLAFYAIALIAGLNVDKFIRKLEDIAKTTWGIDKSRTSSDD